MYGARRTAGVMVGMCLLSGCATHTAPPGWLAPPLEVSAPGYGGWIEVRARNGPGTTHTDGELLAVDRDSVFVLTRAGVASVALGSLDRAKLTAYRSGQGSLAAWTILGVLSTASHGIVLILSAPVWMLVGTGAATAESFVPQQTVRGPWLDRLRAFARFPQGIPADLDRTTLILRYRL